MSRHSKECIRSFPQCICLRCARDGEPENPCCVGKHCGQFSECPDFKPEERTEEDEA